MTTHAHAASVSPTVSVVIPTRNRPQLLEESINAILAQQYEGAIECIVVFDQSEPSPLPSGRGNRSVRGITNTRTPGLAGARNSGILAARSDLVAFCDDDDVWAPQKLSRQIPLFGDKRASVVATGVEIEYKGKLRPRVAAQTVVTYEDLLQSRFMEAGSCTFLARRLDILERIGLVDEDLPGSYGEDWDWLLAAAKFAPVHIVPEALVRVRWHDASFFAERWQTIIEAIKYLLAKYPDLERSPRAAARLYGQIAFAYAASDRRHDAFAWAVRSLRSNPTEKRAFVALLVTLRLLSADRVNALLRRLGRGI